MSKLGPQCIGASWQAMEALLEQPRQGCDRKMRTKARRAGRSDRARRRADGSDGLPNGPERLVVELQGSGGDSKSSPPWQVL